VSIHCFCYCITFASLFDLLIEISDKDKEEEIKRQGGTKRGQEDSRE